MKQAVVGLLAHVDAGKTTLAEAMLYAAGAIRRRGRVDHGDAHLDCDALERERGITIFSKQAVLEYAGCHLMLLDAPGHVDFSAEAERTLAALDYAILVVGANDGVQGHTETLWDLLARYGVPAFVFVNKADLTDDGGAGALGGLRRGLDPACIDGAALLAGEPSALEDAASADEGALDEYLGTGACRRRPCGGWSPSGSCSRASPARPCAARAWGPSWTLWPSSSGTGSGRMRSPPACSG